MNKFFQTLINSFNPIIGDSNNSPIIAKDRKHLDKLIEQCIKKNGCKCDLNHIDVSQITDMSYLFSESWFNGDISKWDTSSVENMEMMFHVSKFRGDISNWDVYKVKNMEKMFRYAVLSCDISQWKPYSLENEKNMFMGSHSYAVIPYWYGHESKEKRIKALDMYHLNKNLHQDLIVNESPKTKKPKI